MDSATTSVRIDNVHGLGAVPWNQEIDYRGFVRLMRPNEFLALMPQNPPYDAFSPAFVEAVRRNGMGTPWLDVAWCSDGFWVATGHEGRHRMQAVLALDGPDATVPVHCFPQGMRRHHLTPEMLAAPVRRAVK